MQEEYARVFPSETTSKEYGVDRRDARIFVNHLFPSHVYRARILHKRKNECVTVVDNSIEGQYDENVYRKRSSHVRINSLKFKNDSINT